MPSRKIVTDPPASPMIGHLGDLPVPTEVELVGGELHWSWFGYLNERQSDRVPAVPKRPRVFRSSKAPEDLLLRFTGLADDADGTRILDFARRYGVIGACGHGLPSTHVATCQPLPAPGYRPRAGESLGTRSDSLAVWRRFAEEAGLLMQVSRDPETRSRAGRDAMSRLEALAGPSPWEQPGADAPLMDYWGPLDARRKRPWRTAIIARQVTRWLAWGDARPVFIWNETRRLGNSPRLALGALEASKPTLFSTLAVQLMSAVAGDDKVAICSACGSGYFRKRRLPKAGQRNYCDDCGRAATVRHAQRARRARQRALAQGSASAQPTT